MRNRILEIAERPARLRIERRQLVVESDGSPVRFPLDDIAVIVVAHPQVSYTQAVLSELSAAGGTFVTCDSSRMPNGILLPLAANSVQTERFRKQLELSQPRQKRAWQQIIKAKIAMQSALLQHQLGADAGLEALLGQVRSGDTANVEARAARRYWTALFGSDFRRDRNAPGHNALLNYGYALLRAATARAIVAAGLHPSLGVHHHNKYNAFCLADDLMEPYRPLIDLTVVQLLDGCESIPTLEQSVRAELLGALTSFVRIRHQQHTLFDALAYTASSLARLVTDDTDKLELPQGFVQPAVIEDA